MAAIPQVTRLAEAFRKAGRPVVYIAHVLKPDYSDAQFPYWRVTRGSLSHNRTFITEGTRGAQVIDELKPHEGEHLVIKKGFGGFSNTPLDTILRNMDVNTCVVTGYHLRLRVNHAEVSIWPPAGKPTRNTHWPLRIGLRPRHPQHQSHPTVVVRASIVSGPNCP